MRMAIVGLGKMGGNMARRLCRGGIEVVGYNRSPEIVKTLAAEEGLIPASSIARWISSSTVCGVVLTMATFDGERGRSEYFFGALGSGNFIKKNPSVVFYE